MSSLFFSPLPIKVHWLFTLLALSCFVPAACEGEVWSCLGGVVTYRWSFWQSDQVLRMIDLKWQRVILFFIYLSRHRTQRPMAWQLSMLHYSNWPMSHLHEGPHWSLFTHALWKYTESDGVKYWYIKRRLTGQRQNPASGMSERRKPQFITCLCFFI